MPAIDSSPIDAFIIGNRAKEHFEKIIKADNITPRDISQLSKLFSKFQLISMVCQLMAFFFSGDNDQSELNTVSRNNITTGVSTHESLSQTSSNTISNRDSNSSDLIVITSSNTKCSDSAVSVTNSFKYSKLASESGYSISSKSATIDESSKTDQVEEEENKMELVELNSSHNYHRELPVDVPDSFVGVVKQTPRYPPPHPPPQPPTRFDSASGRGVTEEKLRKYSEEIYKKKDEEEFLRSSIRRSKKLQQLESSRNQMEPMVNIAFEPDDEVLVAYNNNSYGSFPLRAERESDKGKSPGNHNQ